MDITFLKEYDGLPAKVFVAGDRVTVADWLGNKLIGEGVAVLGVPVTAIEELVDEKPKKKKAAKDKTDVAGEVEKEWSEPVIVSPGIVEDGEE